MQRIIRNIGYKSLLLMMLMLAHGRMFTQTLAAGDRHTVAICNVDTRTINNLQSWGRNLFGKLGDGNDTNSYVPVDVDFLENVSAISSTGYHTLALKSDGTVWICGFGYLGQFGNGDTESSNISVQMTNLSNVSSIFAGEHHSFAIKNDGTVWGWGYNVEGQLGIGNDNYILEPVQNTSLTSITKIAAGYYHNLALKSDGTLLSWGDNYDGQLGTGNNLYSYAPVEVVSLSEVTDIAAGQFFSLALKADSTVWAWGAIPLNGSNMGSYLPVQILSLDSIVSISAQGHVAMALKSDGTVWTWGFNNWYGEIGNGSDTASVYPQQIEGLNDVIEIEGGMYSAIVKRADGTVWMLGKNDFGQLGDGTTNHSSTPIQVNGLCGSKIMTDESEEAIKFYVYPNPFQSHITVKCTNKKGIITMFDYVGKVIMQQLIKEESTTINTAKLIEGVYIITYVNESDNFSLRLVKY